MNSPFVGRNYTPYSLTIGHLEISERLTKTMMDIKIRKIRTTNRSPRKMGIRKINEKTTVNRNKYTPTTRLAKRHPKTFGQYSRNINVVRKMERPKVGTTPKNLMR
jgi:hypothetical protein